MEKVQGLENTGEFQAPITLQDKVKSLRSLALSWESSILRLKECDEFKREGKEGENQGEAIANIMLAYRNVEDARMRLGKIFQAMDGGVSIYDKKTN